MAQLTVYADAGRALITEAVFLALTHLAVGSGAWPADPDERAAAMRVATGLVQEIGRVLFLERFFVVPDDAGTIVGVGPGRYRTADEPSEYIYFRFRFAEDEALGNWSEFGLFGGDVALNTRTAVILDGAQAGDDRANVDVILGGAYTPNENQTLTVTVLVGGGSGVAQIGWVSSGSEPSASSLVDFHTPLFVGGTGLKLTFTGGADGVLTAGDQWIVPATQPSETPTYAAGGVYDRIANEDGQVRTSGRLFRVTHLSPAFTKGAVQQDVQMIVRVLNG